MLKSKTYKKFLYKKHKIEHLKVKVKANKINQPPPPPTLPPLCFFQKFINNTNVEKFSTVLTFLKFANHASTPPSQVYQPRHHASTPPTQARHAH